MQIFKVKVVTFYSGEKSINVLKQKLDEQEKVNIDHVILEYLPLAIAEREFHHILVNTQEKYDFVIKIDADMVPIYKDSIFKMCSILKIANTSRLTLQLLDQYTNMQIFGIHAFSNLNSYKSFQLNRLPDNDIWISKTNGQAIRSNKNLLFYHGVNPSNEQLLRFGYQRGSKLKNANWGHGHWIIAQVIHKNFKKEDTEKNLLIYFGLLLGMGLLNKNKYAFATFNEFNVKIHQLISEINKNDLIQIIYSYRKKLGIYPYSMPIYKKIIFIGFIKILKIKNNFSTLLGNRQLNKLIKESMQSKF